MTLRARLAGALVAGLALVPGSGCRPQPPAAAAGPLSVEVTLDRLRAAPGQAVEANVWVRGSAGGAETALEGSLFVPGEGRRDLGLVKAGTELRVYQARIPVGEDAPQGLYVVTVRAADEGRRAVGKASFIVGKLIGDFTVVSAIPEAGGAGDTARYLGRFREAGGNFLILHDIITQKPWYPSKVTSRPTAAGSADDRLGLALDAADRLGLPCLISVVWDKTRRLPYAEHEASLNAVLAELWSLYGTRPSLAGFYDSQEGSGTYFAAHVRSFADRVKALNKGLLAACAPRIDDPLLAGYLAAVDSLDVVIYQGAYEASWRPDSRKCFPVRRTRDFAALSAGAALPKGKVALSRVELFGYLEKKFAGVYLASPPDAFDQLASAATAAGPDGVALFSYHANIDLLGKTVPEAAEVGEAVKRGLRAYQAIAPLASRAASRVALYVPYSDWWAGRWAESYEPALDALRRLGVAADIVPFIPPRGEEVLPFTPHRANEEQLAYLLEGPCVLVLPDIAGMQDTDSALLRSFAEMGGTVLLFGPRIPYGDSFDRTSLVGGTEGPSRPRLSVEVLIPLDVRVGRTAISKAPAVPLRGWTPTTGRAAAVFEDGTAAVLVNALGKGQVVTVAASLADFVKAMPYFCRDILDQALGRGGKKRPADVFGAVEEMDFALFAEGGGLFFAAANSGEKAVDLRVVPLALSPGLTYDVTDLLTRQARTVSGRELIQFQVKVKPHDVAALDIRPASK